MYLNAPEEFLGDRLAAYGGTLSCCIRNEAGDNQIDAADVVLESAGLRLGCRGGRAGYNWSFVQVRPMETASPPCGEWYVESLGGRRPTRCEFRAVLSALESLQVRADYTHVDDVRFDEVQLVSGAPECAGDLDNDGVVGLVDLALLLAHFGDVGGVGDLDGDGGVGIQDLTTLLIEFGSACQ